MQLPLPLPGKGTNPPVQPEGKGQGWHGREVGLQQVEAKLVCKSGFVSKQHRSPRCWWAPGGQGDKATLQLCMGAGQAGFPSCQSFPRTPDQRNIPLAGCTKSLSRVEVLGLTECVFVCVDVKNHLF